MCMIIYFFILPEGGKTVAATQVMYGILGVNIEYHGQYCTLSCAHVLTQYDRNNIGAIMYSPYQQYVRNRLFPVTDQVDVTYYSRCDQSHPVQNVLDVAWGVVTDRSLVSSHIFAPAGTRVVIQPSGVRAPAIQDETIVLANHRLHRSVKILSLVAKYKSRARDSSGGVIYIWWKKGIKYENPGTTQGDSGTALIASLDDKVIGLHRASGRYGYGCPLYD